MFEDEQPHESAEEPPFISMAEASRRLRLSHHVVRKMVDRGQLASVMIADRPMVRTASVAALLEEAM